MKSEQKTCQSCKTEFTIEPEDFAFYEKMKVPAPTWCPTCRARRRMTWRNERALYRRPCDAPGHDESLISVHAPDSGYSVYDPKYWRGGDWDPLSFGKKLRFYEAIFRAIRAARKASSATSPVQQQI